MSNHWNPPATGRDHATKEIELVEEFARRVQAGEAITG